MMLLQWEEDVENRGNPRNQRNPRNPGNPGNKNECFAPKVRKGERMPSASDCCAFGAYFFTHNCPEGGVLNEKRCK